MTSLPSLATSLALLQSEWLLLVLAVANGVFVVIALNVVAVDVVVGALVAKVLAFHVIMVVGLPCR